MNKAVALKYSNDLPAPIIIAKGKNKLAEKMIKIARENNIQIYEDEKLTDNIIELEAGTLIPEYLYDVIADVFAFVYKVQE